MKAAHRIRIIDNTNTYAHHWLWSTDDGPIVTSSNHHLEQTMAFKADKDGSILFYEPLGLIGYEDAHADLMEKLGYTITT